MRNTGTIFAIASGSGKAAVKVLRVSGPDAAGAAERLGLTPIAPRTAALRKILHPESREQLDRGLVLWFPAPNSYTGEDCLELHIHGGRAVEAAVLNAVGALPGCRMADPGEFTWRAFTNGKMDLTAVEGLGDLIDAETEWQRRQALEQSEGALLQTARSWKNALIACLGLLEGAIDFDDEADAPKHVEEPIRDLIGGILAEFDSALKDQRCGEITREGLRVAILGPPNAGKSSLLNCLVKREAALVSSAPGTTRDAIEVTLDLGGAAVILTDTAGLRETSDEVEAMGIARTLARARQADVILWLSETSETDVPDLADALMQKVVLVRTKADLQRDGGGRGLTISVVSGYGIENLFDLLSVKAATAMRPQESALITRTRHRMEIARAARHLRAIDFRDVGLEIAADEVRRAADDLSGLVGSVETEQVLAEIFSKFCIGK